MIVIPEGRECGKYTNKHNLRKNVNAEFNEKCILKSLGIEARVHNWLNLTKKFS